MKISIICPFYNSKEYLDNAIQSIIRQSHTDWELLLVDDGSIDGSLELAKKYKDHRIKLISKLNGGQGLARNDGINRCTGKYLTFLDSDDYISETYLESVNSILETEEFDVVSTNFSYVVKNKKINIQLTNEEKIIIKPEIYHLFLTTNIFHSAPWGKFYKTDFIKNNEIRFPDFRAREDVYFLNYVFCMSKRIKIVPLYGYFSLIRTGSTEKSPFNTNKLHSLDAGYLAIDLSSKFYPQLVSEAKNYCFIKALNCAKEFSISKVKPANKKKEIKKRILTVLNEMIAYASDNKDRKMANLFGKSTTLFAIKYRLTNLLSKLGIAKGKSI